MAQELLQQATAGRYRRRQSVWTVDEGAQQIMDEHRAALLNAQKDSDQAQTQMGEPNSAGSPSGSFSGAPEGGGLGVPAGSSAMTPDAVSVPPGVDNDGGAMSPSPLISHVLHAHYGSSPSSVAEASSRMSILASSASLSLDALEKQTDLDSDLFDAIHVEEDGNDEVNSNNVEDGSDTGSVGSGSGGGSWISGSVAVTEAAELEGNVALSQLDLDLLDCVAPTTTTTTTTAAVVVAEAQKEQPEKQQPEKPVVQSAQSPQPTQPGAAAGFFPKRPASPKVGRAKQSAVPISPKSEQWKPARGVSAEFRTGLDAIIGQPMMGPKASQSSAGSGSGSGSGQSKSFFVPRPAPSGEIDGGNSVPVVGNDQRRQTHKSMQAIPDPTAKDFMEAVAAQSSSSSSSSASSETSGRKKLRSIRKGLSRKTVSLVTRSSKSQSQNDASHHTNTNTNTNTTTTTTTTEKQIARQERHTRRATMATPAARLQSFKSPHCVFPLSTPTAQQLVDAGFYFDPKTKKKSSGSSGSSGPETDNSDRCVCYVCKAAVAGWSPSDDPRARHAVQSPGCPLLRDGSMSTQASKASALLGLDTHTVPNQQQASNRPVGSGIIGSGGSGSGIGIGGVGRPGSIGASGGSSGGLGGTVSLVGLARDGMLDALSRMLRQAQFSGRPVAHKENMLGMPPEALALIFGRLDAMSRVACMCTCTAWKFVCLMFPLWGGDEQISLGFDLRALEETSHVGEGGTRVKAFTRGQAHNNNNSNNNSNTISNSNSNNNVNTHTNEGATAMEQPLTLLPQAKVTMPLQPFLQQQYADLMAEFALVPTTEAFEVERTTMLVRMMALLRGAGVQAYTSKISMLITTHLQLGNSVEAALCVLLQADDVSWETLEKREAQREKEAKAKETGSKGKNSSSFFRSRGSTSTSTSTNSLLSLANDEGETLDWKKRLYLKAVDYFGDGKYWELGVSLLQELREHKISSEELLGKEREFYLQIKSQDRFFETYFLVEFIGLGFVDDFYRNLKYVFRGKEAESLPNFLNRTVKVRFPRAEILKKDPDDPAEMAQSAGQYIRIRSCKASCEEEMNGQERVFPLTMPKVIRQFHAQHNVKLFKMSTSFRRLRDGVEPLPGHEIDGMWTRDTFVVTHDAFPTIRRISPVEQMIVQDRSPVETSVGTVKEKSADIALRAEQAALSREYKSQFTMTLNGVLDAAVSGGVAKYQEAFFSPRFLDSADDEEKVYLVELELALKDQIDVMRDALEKHRRVAPENIAKLTARLDDLFAKMVESNKQLEVHEDWAADLRATLIEQHRTNAEEARKRLEEGTT
jgi:Inhibitor of Apoptosis domain/DHR-2, Lobe C/F-box domain